MAKDIYDFTPVNPQGVAAGFSQQERIQQSAFDNIDKGMAALQKIPKDIRETEQEQFETVAKRNVDNVINQIDAIGDVETLLEREDTLVPTRESIQQQFGTQFGEKDVESGIARVQAAVDRRRDELLNKEEKLITRTEKANQRKIREAQEVLQSEIISKGWNEDLRLKQGYLNDTSEEGFFAQHPEYRDIPGMTQKLKEFNILTDKNNLMGVAEKEEIADLITQSQEEQLRIGNQQRLVAASISDIPGIETQEVQNYYTGTVTPAALKDMIKQKILDGQFEVEDGLINAVPGDPEYTAAVENVAAQTAANMIRTTTDANSSRVFRNVSLSDVYDKENAKISKIQADKGAPIYQTDNEMSGLYTFLRSKGLEPSATKRGNTTLKFFDSSDKDVVTATAEYLKNLKMQSGIVDFTNFKFSLADYEAMLSLPDTVINPNFWEFSGETDPETVNKGIQQNKDILAFGLWNNQLKRMNIESFNFKNTQLEGQKAEEQFKQINYRNKLLANTASQSSKTANPNP
jgi:hypothetical protein